ncbi:hypothetical protein M8120_02400 [Microcystis aeruginosa str. Chao 1910]|uniref:hypothetical protein n=1 Tax=Microcystis aeruginosa TaxID=1126 RepID=UPI002246666F|nr:hypothetical protein [Microcystis aeruginosa]UZO76925.1 hypothetical protein M8120_02400 [Microcystis aeruginosa str. Chao 1910]
MRNVNLNILKFLESINNFCLSLSENRTPAKIQHLPWSQLSVISYQLSVISYQFTEKTTHTPHPTPPLPPRCRGGRGGHTPHPTPQFPTSHRPI